MPKKPAPPPPSPLPVKAPTPTRRRSVYVAFWLSPDEAAALDEAQKAYEARTKRPQRRSDRMRDLVAAFVREMKMASEFEV